MAVNTLTLYWPGSSVGIQVYEGSQLHLILVSQGANSIPSAPGETVRQDPFPQYIDADELAAAGVGASDTSVAALVTGPGATADALRAAFVAAAGPRYVADLSGGNVYSTDVETGQRVQLTTGLTITAGPVVDGTAVVFTSTEGGRQWAPAAGGDVRNVAVSIGTLAAWGSSSIGGLATRLASVAASAGMTHYNGGIGGAVAETILARYGSRPLLIDAVTIPASGPVTVTASNYGSGQYAGLSIVGSLAGVPGTLAKADGGGQPIVFTRTTGGSTVPVAAGTPFVSAAGVAHRNDITILQAADNNLSGSVGGSSTSLADAIQWTDDAYAYAGTLGKQVLILGYWIDRDVPDGDPSAARILDYNAQMSAKYGRRFLDLGAYVSSSQVWLDTGITPTSDDLSHQARGRKPPSLSADSLHLNTAGYDAVRDLIEARLTELGWITPAPQWPVADDFNRADSTTLGATSVKSKPWTYGAGWTIASNQLSQAGVSANNTATIEVAAPDCTVSATLAAVGATAATSGGGIVVRHIDDSNYWWLSLRQNGSTAGLVFYKNEAGAVAAVGSSSAVQPQAGDIVSVRCEGTTLIGYLNGAEVARVTGATFNQNAKHVGLLGHSAGTATRWDDFAVAAATSSSLVADDFNRANGNLVGSATSTGGAVWGAVTAGTGASARNDVVVTQQAVGPKSGGVAANTFAYVDVGTSDFSVEATVTALATDVAGRGGGLAARVGTDGSGIFLNSRGGTSTDDYAIYYHIAGGSAVMVGPASATVPAIGDRLRLQCVGTTITAFVNGVQVLQVTITDNPSSTRAGVLFTPNGSATRLDNFARVA